MNQFFLLGMTNFKEEPVFSLVYRGNAGCSGIIDFLQTWMHKLYSNSFILLPLDLQFSGGFCIRINA